MDSGVWDQVGLELSQVNVQGSIKSKRCSDRGDDLTDQSIQVGVGWSFDVQVLAANIVDSFIVNHKSTIRVFQSGVSGQNRVVWFNNSR